MDNIRSVNKIYKAMNVRLGSHEIKQALPLHGLEQLSPFILLHHFDFMFEPGNTGLNVPPHPHRGFSPVTYMFEGEIAHNDSFGNSQVIGNNEVQWINAARGIIHSEQTSKQFAEKGGRYQGIQLWINLPAADKMKPASYQPITRDQIVLLEEEGVAFRLVSGSYQGKKGPAHSDVMTATMQMEKGSRFTLSLPAAHNVAIYVLEGSLRISGTAARAHDLVHMTHEQGAISLLCDEAAKLLVLAGQPINEPMVSHGPYVMNTQTEILQAMRDYQEGKMGFLY